MAIREKLERLYFAFEDRYYAALDHVNKVIPIYKIIDPIDRHVPSFVLFVLLIFLVLFWFFLWPLLFAVQQEYAFTTSIAVIDAETSKPIPGADVVLYIPKDNNYFKAKTNEQGIVRFTISTKEQLATLDASLSITAKDYEEIKGKSISLSNGEKYDFKIKKIGIYFKNVIEIYVVKNAPSSEKIDDRIITITFSCLRGSAPNTIIKHGLEQPFKVEKPIGCEGLSATASAQGYKPETMSLEGKETVIFKLEPITIVEKTGTLEVSVTEHDSTAAEDVVVRVYDASTNSLVTQKTTDASGTVSFDGLKPGYYDVVAISNDNRTESKQNIKVNAEEKTQLAIKLHAPEPKFNYKLFFKIIDSESKNIVPDADVIVYMDQYFMKKLRPDQNGIVSYLVSEADKGKSFKITVIHPNYAIVTVTVPVLEISVTTPTIVEIMRLSAYETNYAPVAIIKANRYYGSVPLTVEFDASSSFDPDGTIVRYEWDFGDGTTDTGITKTKNFANKGTYLVKLRVIDQNNLAGETSVLIQVGLDSYAPVAIIRADKYFGKAPLTVSFDASSSFDPDGTIASYEWAFGDGASSREMKPTHTFEKPGSYIVTLWLEDDKGLLSFASTLIQVRKEIGLSDLYAPIAIFTADKYYGVPPLTVSFDASSSFDPDGTIVRYEWDFGDGGTATGMIAAHVFVSRGTYLVKLRVIDQNNLAGETSVLIQVGLDSYAPVAIIRADRYAGKAPLAVDFDASFSFDPDGTIVRYEWDFGDGNKDTGPTTLHVYTKEGIYRVTLKVTDNTNKTDETYAYIQVKTQPAPNIAKALVTVVDLDGKPVQGTAVYLYREDLPFSLNPPGVAIYTNADGKYLFESIEPSIKAYYAKAIKDNLFGESQHALAIAGSTVMLNITLSEDYGDVRVTVVDTNENKIQNADVSFYSVPGVIEARCKTDLAGACNSGPIKAGKMIYAVVSKENYMTSYTNQFQIIAHNMHELKVVLYPRSQTSGIEMSFVELCKDWLCKEKISMVSSSPSEERYYYAKFYLKLFASESTEVGAYLRAGLDAQEALPAQGYKIRLMEARAPTDRIFYATCYNPSNKYEIKASCASGVNTGSKMVLLEWPKISSTNGVVIPIIVKFGVEKALANGDKLEIHFAAKAKQSGKEVKVEEKLQSFSIGELICSEKEIAWAFKLYLDNTIVKEGLSALDATDLNLGQEYRLYYILKNCTDVDYTGAKLEVWDENVENAIAFPDFNTPKPHVLYSSTPSLKPMQSLEDKVKIKAVNVAAFARVLFKLSKGTDVPKNGIATTLFRILSGKGMVFEGLPKSLPPDMPLDITAYLKDANTGKGIPNASIDIYLNDTKLATVTTESNGHFSYKQPSGAALPKAGDFVKLKASHPDYDAASAEIPVKRTVVVGISCVTVSPRDIIKLNKGASGTITIKTSNCPEKVAIKLDSMLALSQKELVMEKDESKSISFTASGELVFQGVYPIYVSGRFVSVAEYKHIAIVDVIVNDPDSCFVMDNYIYDIKSGKATGIITNKCLYANNDPDMPLIKIASSAVELKYAEKPTSIVFKWRIKAEAAENGSKSISIVALEGTTSLDLTKGYVGDLAEFNAIDYINGNAAKGIKGLKQAPGYAGGKLCNVKFIPESDDKRVLVWIEGTKVLARFIGEREEKGQYNFTLINKALKNTQYAFMGIDDYVVR